MRSYCCYTHSTFVLVQAVAVSRRAPWALIAHTSPGPCPDRHTDRQTNTQPCRPPGTADQSACSRLAGTVGIHKLACCRDLSHGTVSRPRTLLQCTPPLPVLTGVPQVRALLGKWSHGGHSTEQGRTDGRQHWVAAGECLNDLGHGQQ